MVVGDGSGRPAAEACGKETGKFPLKGAWRSVKAARAHRPSPGVEGSIEPTPAKAASAMFGAPIRDSSSFASVPRSARDSCASSGSASPRKHHNVSEGSTRPSTAASVPHSARGREMNAMCENVSLVFGSFSSPRPASVSEGSTRPNTTADVPRSARGPGQLNVVHPARASSEMGFSASSRATRRQFGPTDEAALLTSELVSDRTPSLSSAADSTLSPSRPVVRRTAPSLTAAPKATTVPAFVMQQPSSAPSPAESGQVADVTSVSSISRAGTRSGRGGQAVGILRKKAIHEEFGSPEPPQPPSTALSLSSDHSEGTATRQSRCSTADTTGAQTRLRQPLLRRPLPQHLKTDKAIGLMHNEIHLPNAYTLSVNKYQSFGPSLWVLEERCDPARETLKEMTQKGMNILPDAPLQPHRTWHLA